MANFVICPVRNGLHLTRAALRTFLAQDSGDVKVIFIENGSEDGTREYLRSIEDERVRMVSTHPPLGVAASWNLGLELAFNEQREDYALVVNNDVELRPDTMRHLVNDRGLFVTGIGIKERECLMRPINITSKCPHPDFSCFLIRRECFARVGPFCEEFDGGYCEDADYHIRMHRAGITAYCLDLPFYHVASGTIKNASDAERDEICRKADKNRALFKAKYGCEVGTPEYYALFGTTAPEAAPGTAADRAEVPTSADQTP